MYNLFFAFLKNGICYTFFKISGICFLSERLFTYMRCDYNYSLIKP